MVRRAPAVLRGAAGVQARIEDVLQGDLRREWGRLTTLYKHTIKPQAPQKRVWVPKGEEQEGDPLAPPEGQVRVFHPNWAQRLIYWDRFHWRNIVLKARQIGISTFICLLILDRCLVNSNTSAGIIADTLSNATRLLRQKIKFAYRRLPKPLREAVPLVQDAATVLEFANGSRIEVGVSLRSDTLHLLHISEFAKIVAEQPSRTEEVVTGAIPALGQHGVAFMESTARGAEGRFYEYCQSARRAAAAKRHLTPLEWSFTFLPWWAHPEYRVEHAPDAVIPAPVGEYFQGLSALLKRDFTRAQKVWYTQTMADLGGLMQREHPSTPDEAFAASDSGTYFTKELLELRKRGGISSVPVDRDYPVHTWWDIGVGHVTAIWFTQTIGRECRVLDYYEAAGERFQHFHDLILQRNKKWGTRVGQWVGPHDIASRPKLHAGTGTGPVPTYQEEIRQKFGITFQVVPVASDLARDIEHVRGFIGTCVFDEERCALGLHHLEHYGRRWSNTLVKYLDMPADDEHADGADAFRTLARGQALYGLPVSSYSPWVERNESSGAAWQGFV